MIKVNKFFFGKRIELTCFRLDLRFLLILQEEHLDLIQKSFSTQNCESCKTVPNNGGNILHISAFTVQ